jgi:beta-glucosidase
MMALTVSSFPAAILLEALVAAVCLLVAAMPAARWRGLALGVAVFLTLRLLAFDNPVIWKRVYGRLAPEEIGWRQWDVVRAATPSADPAPASAPFLAVGSSQTDAIYRDYAEAHEAFDVLTIAAMSPLDFELYQRQILSRRPRTVLLYLSELDLAQWIVEEAVVMAPRQGWRLARTWRDVSTLPGGERYRTAMVRLLAGELSPELKYGFALRGAAEQAMTRLARRVGRSRATPEGAPIELRIEWIREALTEDALAFNLGALERFVERLGRAGVQVVVVEGSYHPDVLDDRLRALRVRVRAALRELADRHPAVRLIEREEVLALPPEGFRDLTHVEPEVGAVIAHRVARLVGAPAASDQPTPKDRDWWRAQVALQGAAIAERRDAQVVLVGDSITEQWAEAGAAAWRERLGGLPVLNLGLASDRTEHVLWRLDRLPLEDLRPRAAVVMIGTNNVSIAGQSAEEIALGVAAVVASVRRRLPGATVVLLALTPRGDAGSALGAKVQDVNREIAGLADDDRVRFLDVGPGLLAGDGELDPRLLPDGLHLSAGGYEVMARALAPVLAELGLESMP